MLREFVGLMIDSLKKVALADVKQERLDLWKDACILLTSYSEKLEVEYKDLEQKLADSQAKCQQLAEQLAKDEAERLGREAEVQGAWFKRDSHTNEWRETVYCPICKYSIGPRDLDWKFYCPRCNWLATFRSNEIGKVMEELKVKRP